VTKIAFFEPERRRDSLARPTRPHLRVVVAKSRSHRALIVYLSAMALFCLAIAGRVELDRLQIRANDLSQQLNKLSDMVSESKLNLAALQSPERIVTYAQVRLGFTYPDYVEVISSGKGVTAMPQSGSAGTAVPGYAGEVVAN
jgi:cell division protein FtsB